MSRNDRFLISCSEIGFGYESYNGKNAIYIYIYIYIYIEREREREREQIFRKKKIKYKCDIIVPS